MELPLSADILSFIAEGAYSTGSIEVSQSCHSTSENAVVDVEVFYASQQAFDDVTVCSTHRSEREWGLGIFVSHSALRIELCLLTDVSHRPLAGPTLTVTTCSASTSVSGFQPPKPDPRST